MNRVTILFERGGEPSGAPVAVLERALSQAGYSVFVDRHVKISLDWAHSVDENIRRSDAVIAVLSAKALDSEMATYELEVVGDARLKNKDLKFLFVPVGESALALSNMGPLLNSFPTCEWNEKDSGPLIAEIIERLQANSSQTAREILLGVSGGGIGKESPFYIERDGDRALAQHLEDGEPTILIKGARQSGKTSLIGQGIRAARAAGYHAYVTDFQRLGSARTHGEEEFYRLLASDLARQAKLHYGVEFEWGWDSGFGATFNLDEFLRSLLGASERRVVWFMDEAEWLFGTAFADSFFALVRSWHNARALSLDDTWNRLSVVIAYATEAHLFIQDLNQSPFNVGRLILVNGFSLRQTEQLNKRYGEPLRGIDQVEELQDLLDGQPFLTRTAYDYMVRTNGSLRTLIGSAHLEEGPFGDHLRRVLVSVTQLSTVRDVVILALKNQFLPSSPDVERLVASGILIKNSSANHVIRCKLYRKYLELHLL